MSDDSNIANEKAFESQQDMSDYIQKLESENDSLKFNYEDAKENARIFIAECNELRLKKRKLKSENAKLIEAYEKRGILLDRAIDDYNILRGEFNELERDIKYLIDNGVFESGQVTNEIENILNKLKEK